jgi:hypothetical protein
MKKHPKSMHPQRRHSNKGSLQFDFLMLDSVIRRLSIPLGKKPAKHARRRR